MTAVFLTGSNDNSLKVNCHLEYWFHAVSGRDQQIQFEFSNTGDNHYVGFDSCLRQLNVINKHDLLMTLDFSVSFSLASVMMGLLLI